MGIMAYSLSWVMKDLYTINRSGENSELVKFGLEVSSMARERPPPHLEVHG